MPKGSLFKSNFQIVAQVGALFRSVLGPPAAKTGLSEKHIENIREAAKVSLKTTRPGAAGPGVKGGMSKLIITRTLIGI